MKLAFFQGYVVTAEDDGRIPPDATVVAYPLPLVPTPGLVEKDGVACDRRWLVTTFNTMLKTEKRMSEKLAELQAEKSSLQQALLNVTNERDTLKREKKNG